MNISPRVSPLVLLNKLTESAARLTSAEVVEESQINWGFFLGKKIFPV